MKYPFLLPLGLSYDLANDKKIIINPMSFNKLFSQRVTNIYLANEHQLIMQPIKITRILSHWASPSYLTNAHHLNI